MMAAQECWGGHSLKHVGEIWDVPAGMLVNLTEDMAIELSAGKTDRDLLVEMVTVLNRMTEDMHDASKNLEPRIRALENFRWWIMGAAAACSFLGALAERLILK
jgi:hypothetical protein